MSSDHWNVHLAGLNLAYSEEVSNESYTTQTAVKDGYLVCLLQLQAILQLERAIFVSDNVQG